MLGRIFPLLFLAATAAASAQPIGTTLSAKERLRWFTHSTYGRNSLLVSGPIASGLRTWANRPEEWGPGWEGFAQRYGMRLVNNSVMNGVEAGLGAAWGEDPRYHRAPPGTSAGKRVGHALKQVFLNRYEDGQYRFGFAKAAGITTNAFAQNAWMPDSISTNREAALRISNAYTGRAIGHLFREFGPDLFRVIRRKKH
jgi:hypothetical protein